MLRFLFWSLLLANVALFAYQTGYLDGMIPTGHEPDRLTRQINPEKMKPVSASAMAANASSSASSSSSSSSSSSEGSTSTTATTSTMTSTSSTTLADAASKTAKAETLACSEAGSFDAASAKRFETQLQALALGSKLTRRNIQEVAGNMVYIPSQGSKEGAAKKAAELHHLGVNDFYVIQDASNLRWGISLGVFKTEEAARVQLEKLVQKGVHSARVGVHNVTTNKIAFQFVDLGSDKKAGVDKILHTFPNMSLHACAPEQNVEGAGSAKDGKETTP